MGERFGVPIEGMWHVEYVGDRKVHALFGTTVVPTAFPVEAIGAAELCGTLGLTDCFLTYDAWRADVERAGGREAAMALRPPNPAALRWAHSAGRLTAAHQQRHPGAPIVPSDQSDSRLMGDPPDRIQPIRDTPGNRPVAPPTEGLER